MLVKGAPGEKNTSFLYYRGDFVAAESQIYMHG